MGLKISQDDMPRHWVHSHEEDTDTERVFRPASYHFPPSRGRVSFELKSDGTLVEHKIGPTDRPAEPEEGTWRLENDNTLAFYSKSSKVPGKTMQLLSVAKDRLVTKK